MLKPHISEKRIATLNINSTSEYWFKTEDIFSNSFSTPLAQSVACLRMRCCVLQFRFSGLMLFDWLSVIRERLKTGLPLSQYFIFFFCVKILTYPKL